MLYDVGQQVYSTQCIAKLRLDDRTTATMVATTQIIWGCTVLLCCPPLSSFLFSGPPFCPKPVRSVLTLFPAGGAHTLSSVG